MGVEVEQVRILGLLRLVLGDELVGDARGGGAVGVAERQVEPLEQREAPAGVGQAAHADIRDAVDDSLVALVGLGERAAGEDVDLDASAAAALDLLRPLRARDGLHVGGREEDAVGQADHRGRRLAALRAGRPGVLLGRTACQQDRCEGRAEAGHPWKPTGFQLNAHDGISPGGRRHAHARPGGTSRETIAHPLFLCKETRVVAGILPGTVKRSRQDPR